jgi:hypothetical protein
LLTGDDVVFQYPGVGAPYFTQGGSWINVASAAVEGKFIKEATGDIRYNGINWYGNFDARVKTQNIYAWGRDNYVDLGVADDGKEFRLWLFNQTITNLSSLVFEFSSHPFGADIDDDEMTITDGSINDFAMLNMAGSPGYYWVSTNQVSKLTNNRWNLIVLPKTVFSVAGVGTPVPLWSRITEMRIVWTYSIAPGDVRVGGSSLYFGDSPKNVVQTASLLQEVVTNRTGLHLSLDAPADTDANVTVLGSVS